MNKINPDASKLIDKYVSNAPDHFRPLMNELRSVIIDSDNRIAEDWKWGVPNFHYQGIICWMAYFQHHIGINFFKGALINDTYSLFDLTNGDIKGNRIMKIKSQSDLNTEAIRAYVKDAILLNEKGSKPRIPKTGIQIPDDFMAALISNNTAWQVYEAFPSSYKRGYVEWILGAKRMETRKKRITQALEWISEGKDRNWKYKTK